ncbi:hypothetical protein Nepgr_007403 [Nepenthes gracilis]|uniref:Uncharacterized protein n=1 Tax=Nepenthes gracilis TaxID=150966 RepID=A0AAD3XI98_NEPGR|nr:hypothetical protein Nepgr_007403 [Nepenthes gracilis]
MTPLRGRLAMILPTSSKDSISMETESVGTFLWSITYVVDFLATSYEVEFLEPIKSVTLVLVESTVMVGFSNFIALIVSSLTELIEATFLKAIAIVFTTLVESTETVFLELIAHIAATPTKSTEELFSELVAPIATISMGSTEMRSHLRSVLP